MPTFPRLKSGAIAQYPLEVSAGRRTQVYAFVDGSEQRSRGQAQATRRWLIELRQLDEEELESLRSFFEQQQGSYGRFAFTDPETNVTWADCSFEGDVFPALQEGEDQCRSRVIVRTNRP